MTATTRRLAARLLEALDSDRVVPVACAISLVLGAVFLAVWSPLPWGWEGIDHYHDRAIRLAAGLPFDTTDVPWGYAYYLSIFYRVFGPHAWIPLVVQVIANAAAPWLLFRLVVPIAGRRVAALSALLLGVFSFNTVYASTQSTDSLCTVLFLGSLLCLERAVRSRSGAAFAAAGLLVGLAAQFRPNLVLFPLVAAAVYFVARRDHRRAMVEVSLYLVLVGAVFAPWVVRNYLLTGAFVPTSTHGGVQLWYGSLQTGPYLEDRAANPRSAFETAALDYTSLSNTPIVIDASHAECDGWRAAPVTLVYRTDRDGRQHRIAATDEGETVRFLIPGQPSPTTVRYYFEAGLPGAGAGPVATPANFGEAPFILFVSTDHLGDLDRDDDFLDPFDLMRLVQAAAWPAQGVDRGHADAEVAEAAAVLAGAAGFPTIEPSSISLSVAGDIATVHLPDGSTLDVPRGVSVLADVVPTGPMAGTLAYSHVQRVRPDLAPRCGRVMPLGANDVFYRRELHDQRRYLALAFDNIRRAPLAYAVSVAYRAVRLFVIRGSDDSNTTQQFAASQVVFALGTALSGAYLLLFLAGAVVAIRSYPAVLPLLLPVVYVPATISFVLTNMRYTVTVQPYMFVFVALALLGILGRVAGPGPGGDVGPGAPVHPAGR